VAGAGHHGGPPARGPAGAGAPGFDDPRREARRPLGAADRYDSGRVPGRPGAGDRHRDDVPTGGHRAGDLARPYASAGGPAGPPPGRRPERGFGARDERDFPATGETPAYAGPGETAPFTPQGARPAWDEPGPGWEEAADDDGYTDTYDDDAYYDEYGDLVDPEELDELPGRRGCRIALVALAVIVVMALVAGWFGWSWVQGKINPSGGQGEEVLVEIPEGTSTAGIGEVLADHGVISDATVWDWYTKLRDVPTIQAGSYRLRLNSSFDQAIDALAQNPLPLNSLLVTVPEGLTQEQIVERLADPDKGVDGFTVEGLQAALDDPESRSQFLPSEQPELEGTLYPETYAVEDDDTETVVIQRMVAQFDEVMTDLDAAERADALGITPYEAVIVASMVEREAGTVEDGPRVARVIYNRLAAGEALGIDATSCYEKGGIPCELTTAELQEATPYNTRVQPGLPPTPIASPGRVSIEAALAPAEGDWNWYVLDVDKDDGSSIFTNDYDEFLAAKDRCVQAGRCG
jgi:UPF0755 protein